MAIAFVQKTGTTPSGDATGTIATPAFASSVTAGNRVIVGVTSSTSLNGQVTGVTDNFGNTYVQDATFVTVNRNMYIYSAQVTTGGASLVVTATLGTSAARWAIIHAYEYSGLNTSRAIDVTGVAAEPGAAATAVSIPTSFPTSVDNSLVFAVVGSPPSAGSAVTFTVGAGYGNFLQSGSTTFTSGGQYLATEDKIVSATGIQTATYTASLVVFYSGLIATYAMAGSTPALHSALPGNIGPRLRVGDGESRSEAVS